MEKLHPLEFSYQEMRLLRSMLTTIEELETAYPGVTPHAIMKKYIEIKEFYAVQLANEEYEATTSVPLRRVLEGFD